MSDLIDIVEASYDLEGSDAQWLRNILLRASPTLDRGLGLFGFVFDVGRRDTSWMWGAQGLGDAEQYQGWVAEFYESLSLERRQELFCATPAFGTIGRTVTKGLPRRRVSPLRRRALAHGFRDAIAVCARTRRELVACSAHQRRAWCVSIPEAVESGVG